MAPHPFTATPACIARYAESMTQPIVIGRCTRAPDTPAGTIPSRHGTNPCIPASEDIVDWIDLLQWPAMLVTVIAAWLIGSLRPGRRFVGFCCFLLSNLLWVIWGWHAEAWALITLQVCLALMNIRGVKKNDGPTAPVADAPGA